MDAVRVLERIGLLLRAEDLALSNGVERRVGVLSVLRQRRDVYEVHRHSHRLRHAQRGREESPVGARIHRGRRPHDRGGLHRTLDPVRVVPVRAPT